MLAQFQEVAGNLATRLRDAGFPLGSKIISLLPRGLELDIIKKAAVLLESEFLCIDPSAEADEIRAILERFRPKSLVILDKQQLNRIDPVQLKSIKFLLTVADMLAPAGFQKLSRAGGQSTPDKKHRNVDKLQERMMSRLMKANPAFLGECEFRPVRSAVELKLAANLVYREYIRRDYSRPNLGEVRLCLNQFIQNSATIVAIYQKKYILGTITVIEDSALGMPIDQSYQEELKTFRAQGRKLFEAGMLAMNDHILGQSGWNLSPNDRMVLVLHMMKATVHYFRNNTDRDLMVACFHPKHEFFYQGIHMQPFAGLKNHKTVEGSPAVGYYWDLTKMEANPNGFIEEFFGFGKPKEAPYPADRRLKLKIDDFGEMFLGAA